MNAFVFVLVLTGTGEYFSPENDIDVFRNFEQCRQASATVNQNLIGTGQVATCFPRQIDKESMAFVTEMQEKIREAQSAADTRRLK